MHCYICDKEDDLITFDKALGEFSPCTTCQNAIQECLESFEEDDLYALPVERQLGDGSELGGESSTPTEPSAPQAPASGHLESSLLSKEWDRTHRL